MAELTDDTPKSNPQVTFHSRFTRNLGNYESLQIEVGVTDSPRGDEKVGQAYNRIKEFVEEKLIDAVEEVEKDIVSRNLKKN